MATVAVGEVVVPTEVNIPKEELPVLLGKPRRLTPSCALISILEISDLKFQEKKVKFQEKKVKF